MMENSRISRSHDCNIHTNQKIISVCLEKDCYRPALCLECLSDAEIHPAKHEQIVALEEFFTKVDQTLYEDQKANGQPSVAELKEFASHYGENLSIIENRVEVEKKIIEDRMNEIITSFVMKCHSLKQEVFAKIEKQGAIYKRNYKNFSKIVRGLKSDDQILLKQSSFTSLNKTLSYNQLEALIHKYQKEMATHEKGSPKKENAPVCKLAISADIIKNNTENPFGCLFTETDFQTITDEFNDRLHKFFGYNLKLHREFSSLDLDTSRKLDSLILNNEDLTTMNSFLKDDYKKPVYELIYRGSRDGLSSDAFYQNCKKGPTLLVIRSKTGKVFGGYTDADWIVDEKYKNSSKSFLFSLEHQEKFPLKAGHQQYAIKATKELGPCFGGGHDLRISADFVAEECSGYIGFSYESQGKFARDVYGENSFFIDEIETFRVTEEEDESDDEEVDVQEVEVLKLIHVDNEEEEKKDNNDDEKLFKNVDDDEYDWEEELLNSKTEEERTGGSPSKGTPSISNLISYEDLETLLDWIDKNRDFTLDLLYRGSRDGFAAKDFHKKCDKTGPTITLIKTKKSSQVFGGFTKQHWDSSNSPGECKETFLFSVTKKKKFPVLEAESAIFRSESSGPVFGEGDLFISSNCHKNTESYSNLGVGFNAAGLDDSVSFFASEQYFTVEEIEVFQVIFFQ